MNRGTAMAETAVTLSFTLLLIFGALQLSLIGYFQLQLDGATFFFSHAYASGSTNIATLNARLGPLFPSVPMNIVPIFQNPPQTDVMPDFTQWGTLTNRYGGVSILRPQRLQAQAATTLTSSIFGSNIRLTAGSVDGRAVIGNHDDDAGGYAYDSIAAYSNVVDPLTQDDQNVPPYYITLAFMWYCNYTPPSGQTWSTCPNGARQLRSLGLAEYLKDDNYNTPANGIDAGGTFYYAKCHQRYFSALSIALSFLPTRQWAQTAFGQRGSQLNNALAPIYAWDSATAHAEPGNSPQLGKLYPLNPGAGC